MLHNDMLNQEAKKTNKKVDAETRQNHTETGAIFCMANTDRKPLTDPECTGHQHQTDQPDIYQKISRPDAETENDEKNYCADHMKGQDQSQNTRNPGQYYWSPDHYAKRDRQRQRGQRSKRTENIDHLTKHPELIESWTWFMV